MRNAAVTLVLTLLCSAAESQIEDDSVELITIDKVLPALPVVFVRQDDVRINRSCIIRIPKGTIINDDEGDGVIHIVGNDVIVLFEEGSVLQGRAGLDRWIARGCREGEGWDTLTGTGIAINGYSGVEIVGANIRGYRNGIVASDAVGLAVIDTTLTDLYHQRLTSTATREGASDWLSPHNNDNNEWLTNYGAAIWAERCHDAKFDSVKVRRGQNGIVLDNTNHASVMNSDCSFLSGWGLAMWRASNNEIERNQFNFCVRGHVEGVYNRGQDSAGILMFEACTDNRVFSNSCTHSGDGIFGFGGNDAVKKVVEGSWGNANNRFVSNDLSFAAAHGLEMTFSESNVIQGNLFESNAICGIWGGYSQEFDIEFNKFHTNGGMAYGQERGAINIEHGSGHQIHSNKFINNKCGVRLWWDFDESLLSQPGVASRYRGVMDNSVFINKFVMNNEHPFGDEAKLVGIEVQDLGNAPGFDRVRVGVNAISLDQNTWDVETDSAVRSNIQAGTQLTGDVVWPAGNGRIGPPPERKYTPGREWIIVDQWGPWDFQTPLLREQIRSGREHIYEIYTPGSIAHQPRFKVNGAVTTLQAPVSNARHNPWRLIITPIGDQPVSSYTGIVHIGDDWSRSISGRFINATWTVRCWAWETDPLTDLDTWREEANDIEPVTLDQLDLPFGYNGPKGVSDTLSIDARDRFAFIAQSQIKLPIGTWKLSTLSDDGIRVFINGKQIIERWDIHGPSSDEAIFKVTDDTPTQIELEYFENDGYATLELDLQAVD